MLKLLYISSEYPPETGNGGIGTYTKYIAESMQQRGHTVYVVCKSIDNSSKRTIQNGIHVHRIPPNPFPLPQSSWLYMYRSLARHFFYNTLVRLSWAIAAGNEVSRIYGENGADIIEYPECGAEGLCIPDVNALKVVRLHTSWTFVKKLDHIKERPGDEIVFSSLERHSIKKADLITSPTQAMINESSVPKKSDAIQVIPNPIPTNQFVPSKGGEWIYTGRVEMRKGVHILIEAYCRLCASRDVPALTIVGAPYGTDATTDMTYECMIETQIQNSGYANKIIWHKGLPLGKVYGLLQNSSAAFFPSLWENFPYSCLEAMAIGCTIIASDCGGYPEMITHDSTGILVKTGSVDALTNAMSGILENPAHAKKLGEAARAHVMKYFDSTRIGKQMEDLYITGIRSKEDEK